MKTIRPVVIAALLVALSAAPLYAQSDRLAVQEGKVGSYADEVASSLNIPSLAVGVVGTDETHYLDISGEGETDEPFLIGSLSKSVTAMAVMLLVDDGAISLDDAAAEYVDGVPDDVTVEDLLRHRSGLDRADGFDAWSQTDATVREAVEAASWDAEGDESSYANLNYEILGVVIEEASDESFADFVDGRIFTPLGLEHASAAPEPPDERIVGHQYLFGFPVAFDEPAYNPAAVPSGFVWMSAEDMEVWMRTFLEGGRIDGEQVIPASVVEALLDEEGEYAMGWATGRESGSPSFSHTGLTGAFSAAATMVPERNVAVFALANVNSWMGSAPESVVESVVGAALRGETQSHSNLEFLVRLGFGLLCFFVVLLFLKEVLQWVTGRRPVALDKQARKAVLLDVFIAAAVIAGTVLFFGVSPLGMLAAAPDLGIGFLLLVFVLPLRRLVHGFNATEERRVIVGDEVDQ
ncbi:MAG: serine hydrolase domain-containing protein [Persicimonas sp.]